MYDTLKLRVNYENGDYVPVKKLFLNFCCCLRQKNIWFDTTIWTCILKHMHYAILKPLDLDLLQYMYGSGRLEYPTNLMDLIFILQDTMGKVNINQTFWDCFNCASPEIVFWLENFPECLEFDWSKYRSRKSEQWKKSGKVELFHASGERALQIIYELDNWKEKSKNSCGHIDRFLEDIYDGYLIRDVKVDIVNRCFKNCLKYGPKYVKVGGYHPLFRFWFSNFSLEALDFSYLYLLEDDFPSAYQLEPIGYHVRKYLLKHRSKDFVLENCAKNKYLVDTWLNKR